MFWKWPVRAKVFFGLGLLLAMVAVLTSSGLYSAYTYRALVKTLSWRVNELPLAAELSSHVADMRVTLSELRGLRSTGYPETSPELHGTRGRMARDQFALQLSDAEGALMEYRSLLEHKLKAAGSMADTQPEQQCVQKIELELIEIAQLNSDQHWMLDEVKIGQLEHEVDDLRNLVEDLPTHLHATLKGFSAEVRGQYHTVLIVLWATSLVAAIVFAIFVRLSYRWIFQPLDVLIRGSRIVAGGDFNYRLKLRTADEMAELAEALNDMTSRFRSIRDDLDRQVQERTKQVVRSEQLASVGFLAAGVAHEINNPLASIAMCAESLESRVSEMLAARVGANDTVPDAKDENREVIVRYMRMIQSEAFRCKGITEKLLDFSRIGPPKRLDTDLREMVAGVIEMIGHLGRYQGKTLEIVAGPHVVAPINSQEIKQVLLNLFTNALDSIDEQGRVLVSIAVRDGMAEISVADDGHGMEADVLERVFEPFFTRRRAGQGTGLGLSISYRIVADHGGLIEAESAGPGCGATFHVRLPLMKQGSKTVINHAA